MLEIVFLSPFFGSIPRVLGGWMGGWRAEAGPGNRILGALGLGEGFLAGRFLFLGRGVLFLGRLHSRIFYGLRRE